jgi:hypothetical protein
MTQVCTLVAFAQQTFEDFHFRLRAQSNCFGLRRPSVLNPSEASLSSRKSMNAAQAMTCTARNGCITRRVFCCPYCTPSDVFSSSYRRASPCHSGDHWDRPGVHSRGPCRASVSRGDSYRGSLESWTDYTASPGAGQGSTSSAIWFILAMTSTPKGQRSMHNPHSVQSEALAGSAS